MKFFFKRKVFLLISCLILLLASRGIALAPQTDFLRKIKVIIVNNKNIIIEKKLSESDRSYFNDTFKISIDKKLYEIDKWEQVLYLEKENIIIANGNLFYFDEKEKKIKGKSLSDYKDLNEEDLIKNIYNYEKQNILREKALEKCDIKKMLANPVSRSRTMCLIGLLKFFVNNYSDIEKRFNILNKDNMYELIMEKISLRLFWLDNNSEKKDINREKIEKVLEEYKKAGESLEYKGLEEYKLSNPANKNEGKPCMIGIENSNLIENSVDENMRMNENEGFQAINRETGEISFKYENKKYADYADLWHLMKTKEEHIRNMEKNKKKLVLADINNDNLFLDKNNIVWDNGKIFFPISDKYSELDNFIKNKKYNVLIFYKNGSFAMTDVCFKNIKYKNKGIYKAELFLNNKNISNKVRFAVYGEAFFKNNEKLNIGTQISNNVFHDLRHVFFPIIFSGKEDEKLLKIEFKNLAGEKLFYGVNVLHEDIKLAEKAYKEPVEIFLKFTYQNKEKFFKSSLLENRGYKKVLEQTSLKEGEYYIIQETTKEKPGIIKIFFKKAIYPQLILGISKDGKMKVIYMPGESRKRGIIVKEAQDICLNLGLKDAMFFVNGGSVHLDIARKRILPFTHRLSGTANLLIMSDVSIKDLSKDELQALYCKFELEQFEHIKNFA